MKGDPRIGLQKILNVVKETVQSSAVPAYCALGGFPTGEGVS